LAKDPHLLRTVNVDGTRILLEEAAAAGVGKVVHTSSSAVFGVPDRNPVLPSDVPHPREAYGHAKLAAEWACLDATARRAPSSTSEGSTSEGSTSEGSMSEGSMLNDSTLEVSIVRPRTILGHGRLGIFGILFDWIADGADPLVLGRGDNRYQFVHADDLAEACLREAWVDGSAILNVGAGDVHTMADTLRTLCAHADTGAKVRTLPAGPTAGAMRAGSWLGVLPFAPYHWLMYARSMWFDTEHLGERLGWMPTRSTPAMFAESYDWFLDNRACTGSSGTSHHRRSTRQGGLAVAKRLTGLLPEAP
jgi:nucleoside-diphosphate-sugar epimerase